MNETSLGESQTSDIVIVGAGPAGMAAASSASESGVKVLVVDDNPTPGGQIWRGADTAHLGRLAAKNFERFRKANVQFISGAQVISGSSSSKMLLVETPERLIELQYRKLILATGARELFLPFPGWTLPGIVGVGGLQALAKSGLPVSGKRIVIAGSGPLLLAVAAYLKEHGGKVLLIAEQASRTSILKFAKQLLRYPGKLIHAAALQRSLLGVSYLQNCWVEAADGESRLRRVRLRQGQKSWTLDCDFAAVAYGLIPNTELTTLLGCKISDGRVTVDEMQMTSVADVFCAGENTGIGGVDLSVIEGEIAGYAAVGMFHNCGPRFAERHQAREFARALNAAFALRKELTTLPQSDTIVCRCEDVTYGALRNASSFRAAKLQLRCGMGPCQGRICGAATEVLFGWKTDSIRPPIFPARIASLAAESDSTEDESQQSGSSIVYNRAYNY